MDEIRSSYQFHRELESPAAFLRREWQSLAVFGGAFAVILFVGILAVEPAYFYSRLSTDPLLYYLKGLSFAEVGHGAAKTAVNLPPFAYVSTPGILRVPFMMAFRDFDDQLRAIQVSNIALVSATAVMYSYVLSWTLSRARHWMAIGFSFAFMLLSPNWLANVFEPLADAPYAAFTIGFIIVSARLLCSDRPLRSRPLALAGAAILFALAFSVKYTAPVLLAYVVFLALGRRKEHGIPRRVLVIGASVAVAAVVLMVLVSWETMRRSYLGDPLIFAIRGDKVGMILNLLGVAGPSQIIPDFNLTLTHDPIVDRYYPKFGRTPGDVAFTALGVVISLVTGLGIWRARHRFVPEVSYFLAGLPVLAVMIPSTARYLMPYQPLIWIFFYAGVSVLVRPFAARFTTNRFTPIAGLILVLLATSGLMYIRSQRMVGTAGDRAAGISIGRTREYVDEVSSTFGDLRRFLQTLPKDRTRLIGAFETMGRWKVIAGLDYYSPDSLLSVAARKSDIYVVQECGTLEQCRDFGYWDRDARRELGRFGDFSLEPVFYRASAHAKAKVYRLKTLQ